MARYTEDERAQLARDVVEQLKTLLPGDAASYRVVARRLADADITVSMVEDLAPVLGTKQERIEHALARALVDMEDGPLDPAAGNGSDQEVITWNIRNLSYTQMTFEVVWAN
ncbi:hypothetical protein [Streptomyces sp. NPDC056682]|uniref:hypothetical protein n=1 Tax=Streptomyces sp. NPDC056682 TaxID=3345909 RepID=UPI0036A7C07A